jgi:hypothetical protein
VLQGRKNNKIVPVTTKSVGIDVLASTRKKECLQAARGDAAILACVVTCNKASFSQNDLFSHSCMRETIVIHIECKQVIPCLG